MTKYLDPKNGVVFKKIFGEHPHLLTSLLNALLKIDDDSVIENIEYMPCNAPERQTVIDVLCKNICGKQFIVELQMETEHVSEFMNHVLYDTAKIYSSQKEYVLKQVYELAILNKNFYKTNEYYHRFGMINNQDKKDVIDGLNFIFIELPKFEPQIKNEKEMTVLWLRFLKEINGETISVSPELIANKEISEAIKMCEESAYTEAEKMAYNKFNESSC